jgi:deoxyribodipyrimidine photolyase
MTKSSSGDQSKLAEISQQLNTRLMELLEAALEMRLDISGDDEAYTLKYISEKLAKCSWMLEQLNGFQGELAKIHLELLARKGDVAPYLRMKEKELKASQEYQDLDRNAKGHWLESQLEKVREEVQVWSHLIHVVSEVKETVGERVVTLRRSDSAIRLQIKLLEIRVGATGANPNRFPGNTSRNVDLDLTKEG